MPNDEKKTKEKDEVAVNRLNKIHELEMKIKDKVDEVEKLEKTNHDLEEIITSSTFEATLKRRLYKLLLSLCRLLLLYTCFTFAFSFFAVYYSIDNKEFYDFLRMGIISAVLCEIIFQYLQN